MADTVQFELVSPERLMVDKAVAMVVIPGMEGDFGVLPGHAPAISTIRPGVIEVYERDGAAPERLFVRGGLADVRAEGLIVLAEDAVDPAQVDMADLDRELLRARDDLANADTDFDRDRAETEIAWREALKAAATGTA
ncbi:ATP synthase F1 subunit epsilon [Rhodothalassium salexigens]|uniref:ATP synthase F1 subunit epsilon n=1 Tax=Rhodothalassium salexigens TaxID=1086 RepID=UPI0019145154|nr:ATP synthase F1 subunit epsilon [Rhodothalassium salexigens]MBK5912693.1 ATP synthase F1 subunit epsilon [Rhodothalassium salexigens]MBK5919426.1 ATP synthase F1 subunit epsilon [Rhodothalassium salexigens]